jgi:hypothetical protein
MKHMILIILLTLFSAIAKAPPAILSFPILIAEKIQVFDPMLFAFEYVESSFDPDTINRLGYGGILQIGQEMINEANRLCILYGLPDRFVLNDRINIHKAEKIWYIVHYHWNPTYKYKKACHVWNPLGSKGYDRKVKDAIIRALYFDMVRKLFGTT